MTAIITIERMMKATMTGAMRIENQKFMSMTTKIISPLESGNFSSTVGGMHFLLQSHGNHAIDVSVFQIFYTK